MLEGTLLAARAIMAGELVGTNLSLCVDVVAEGQRSEATRHVLGKFRVEAVGVEVEQGAFVWGELDGALVAFIWCALLRGVSWGYRGSPGK